MQFDHDILCHLLDCPPSTTIIGDSGSYFMHSPGSLPPTLIPVPCIYSVYSNQQIDLMQKCHPSPMQIRAGVAVGEGGVPLFLAMVSLHPALPKMEAILDLHHAPHRELLLALALGDLCHIVIVADQPLGAEDSPIPNLRITMQFRTSDQAAQSLADLLARHMHSPAPRNFDREKQSLYRQFNKEELWKHMEGRHVAYTL